MDNAAQKVKDWWEVADRTQRMVTVFGIGALVVLLILTAYVMSQPRMTLLASGLTSQDQNSAVEALSAEGIPVDYGPKSSLMVPSNKVQEAKMIIGNLGITSSGGPDAFSIMFGGQMFEGTDKERERIRLAKESEIAKTIASWQGVSSASVLLNIEKKSAFVGSGGVNNSSATVSITESGVGFGSAGGKSVAKLVQNATGIPAENISVMNNLGRMLYQGDLLNQDGTAPGQKLQAEIQEAERRERDLKGSLDMAFGVGNTVAMIQVELDMDTVEKSTVTKTPSESPTRVMTTDEKVTGGGGQVSGGVSGYESNRGQPNTDPNVTNSEPGGYEGSAKDEYYPEDVEKTSLVKAPGALLGMTVQVIVNSAKVTDIKAVESIAKAYLGVNSGKTGFTSTVTATEFDTEANKDREDAVGAAKSSQMMQQAITLLPVLALIVVGFLVIRAISKAAASKRQPMMLAPAGAMPVQFAQPQYPTGASPQAGSSNQHEALQDMPAPETEAGQALASALQDGEIHDALKIIEEMPEDDEIKAIRARINVPLEQIKHMAKTKPESVAMLLKGWMLEDLR